MLSVNSSIYCIFVFNLNNVIKNSRIKTGSLINYFHFQSSFVIYKIHVRLHVTEDATYLPRRHKMFSPENLDMNYVALKH